MQKKSIALFVVCGLVAAMFFFSLGIVTSRPAQAQPIYSKLAGFPRQSELWSITAGENSTWSPSATGKPAGYRFTVSGDSYHRLPVLTTIHTGPFLIENTYYSCKIYKEVDGQWFLWDRGDFAAINSNSSVPSTAGSAPGQLLTEGEWLVTTYSPGPEHAILLSGYMALP